ncbi:MAG: type II toxin-antitoxin system VapC family toxin [Ignavibacteriae bacterium]|nr:type II toxin-antitoxin system VapC family toxin [Ignavibacteriota bacterium]
MNQVYADAFFWIAFFNRRDKFHIKARSFATSNKSKTLVTTDAVLLEVLNQFASQGEYWRNLIAKAVEKLLQDSKTRIIPLTRTLFNQGLTLYKTRLDKEYSFVDCISMVVMKQENIKEVLSNDHHFVQEGFATLL